MTKDDWQTQSDPHELLKHLRTRACDRELRLFMCACCRSIWSLLTDARSRRAVEVAERFAQGLAGEHELATAENAAWDATNSFLDILVQTPRDDRQSIRIAVEGSKAAAEAAICKGRHEDRANLDEALPDLRVSSVWASAWVCCNIVRGVVRRVRSEEPREVVEAAERARQADLLRECVADPLT